MSTICQIDWCGRPTPDQAYVCQHCAARLERALGDVPALWDELDIVLTRQARYSAAQRRGAETALAFNAQASTAGTALRNILNTWCRLIGEERGRQLPDDDHPAAVARWLLHHVPWIRHHRAGADCVEEVLSVVNGARRAVDRPAPRVYAGPCQDCGKDMYAKPDAAMVMCRPCGVEYPVADMVAWMRAQVYGRLVTAKEAVTLLGRFGLPVQQKTIDKWYERKRLTSHGHDPEGKRLYLFDDLVELAAAAVQQAS